jgi:hypothetical protein
MDDRGRFKLTHWKCKAQRSMGERGVQIATTPYTVAPLSDQWRAFEQKPSGPARIALFVNASPLDPRQQKLRAWDRAFLLGSVASVLRSLPPSSVQLVAFNLEQGREIYRDSNFQVSGLSRLEASMEKLELGVVSIHTLSEGDGGAGLLRELVANPTTDHRDPEAIIFLGPWTRSDISFPKRSAVPERMSTRLHDIVYFFPALRGREPTDTVQQLTKSLNGTVHRIHSPGELAQALNKISTQLTRPGIAQ